MTRLLHVAPALTAMQRTTKTTSPDCTPFGHLKGSAH